MKIYIDFSKQAITKIDSDVAYVGDVYSNVFELLFYNYGVATDWFPTMSQLAPNGREAGDFSADALEEDETYDYVEDDITYKRYKFTIGDGWVKMKGRSNFFIWVNKLVDSNTSLQRKCYGKVMVTLNESTDNYFIQDAYLNPNVKEYIDNTVEDAMETYKSTIDDEVESQNETIASLIQASPSVFDTASNITALTENKGVAVATDTGYIYYWDSTLATPAYVSSGLQYNSLANYVKHNGNQLQDGNGNNIFPNVMGGSLGFICAGNLAINTTALSITSTGIQYNGNNHHLNISLANQTVTYNSNSHGIFIYFDKTNNTILAYDVISQYGSIKTAEQTPTNYLIAILYNSKLTFTLSSDYITINGEKWNNIIVDNGILNNDNTKTSTHYPFIKYSANGKQQKAIIDIHFTAYTTKNVSLHVIRRNELQGSNYLYGVSLWNNDTNSLINILNVLASNYTEKQHNTFNNVNGFSGYFDIDWSVITSGSNASFSADRPKILPICFDIDNTIYEEVAIPSIIPVVINREIRLEYYNLLKCDNINDYTIYQNTNTSIIQNLQTALKIKTSSAGNTNEKLSVYKNGTLLREASFTIKSVDDSTKPTIKAIFIGDSFTDSGYYLAELKTLMGNNLTLYGTRTSTALNSSDVSVTTNDEGRAGWSAGDYISQASKNGVTNPFYNNGFDFSYYITNNPSYSDVTDVFILLGTNDGASNQYVSRMTTIINSIKAYNSNIKIHLMIPTPPIRSGYAYGTRNNINVMMFKNYMFTHAKEIIDNFSSTTNVSIIATNLNVDCWYDFPKTEVAVNMRNPELVEVGNDNVHPNRYGYYRLADMIYADIIANS